MSIAGFFLFVIVAVVCAWIAQYFAPGRIPGGFFTATIVGIIGAWLGNHHVCGTFGPSLQGVSLLPTIIGSAVLVFTLAMLSKKFRAANV